MLCLTPIEDREEYYHVPAEYNPKNNLRVHRACWASLDECEGPCYSRISLERCLECSKLFCEAHAKDHTICADCSEFCCKKSKYFPNSYKTSDGGQICERCSEYYTACSDCQRYFKHPPVLGECAACNRSICSTCVVKHDCRHSCYECGREYYYNCPLSHDCDDTCKSLITREHLSV